MFIMIGGTERLGELVGVFHFVAFGQKGDSSEPIGRELRILNRNNQSVEMSDRDNGDSPVEDSQHGDSDAPPRAVIEASTSIKDGANVNYAEKGK